MKKILVFLLLWLYMTDVSALTYSQYSKFSEYQDEVIESNELTDVKKQRRYKYYKLNKIMGPYEKENISNDNYLYIDYNDYTYIESDYQSEKPEEQDGRIITTHTLYEYKKVKDLTSIRISNISEEDIDINLDSISVQYKKESIDYEIEYKDATINNIKPNGYINIKFKDDLMAKDLNVSINTDNNNGKLLISGFNNNLIISKDTFSLESQSNINYNLSYLNVIGNAYDVYYTEEYLKTCPATIYMRKTTNYKYKDILYRKYNLEKEYYKDYLVEPYENYIYKDENLYKDYYAKRTRTIINEENKPVKILLEQNKQVFNKNLQTLKLDENKINKETKKPSMLLQIDNDKIFKKTKDKVPTKKQTSPYRTILILFFIILILVLSKLYKKKK